LSTLDFHHGLLTRGFTIQSPGRSLSVVFVVAVLLQMLGFTALGAYVVPGLSVS
jgi:hypothetical protein